ncbi:TRAP transporter substrate-binding protein DctP [Ammonicoccus fulvus]|uniref:TRAP transporter substrate-binding protein DctP n=1 Tax=Ammonicoccus fulvus TaxID=3138240 RepID=A0ABZ3FQV0_9ACTN
MRIRALVAGLVAIAMLLLSACSGAGAGSAGPDGRREVTISVVSAFDRDDPLMEGFWLFEKNLKESAPWVKLDYRGAGEVMASAQLGEGVSTGGIDMAATAAVFHSQNVPMTRAMALSPLSPAEEREKGAHKLYEDAHAKAGIHYLGRMADEVPYKLYFKDQVNPLDLKGKSIRTSPVYVGLLEALGAGPVAMPPGEVFGAMERGVVAGYGWPALGVVKNGWVDVTGYETSAEFYTMDTVVIMSDLKWQSLDEDTQKAISDAMIKTENEVGPMYADLVEKETKERADGGVKVIEMNEADTKKFVDTAYEAGWKQVLSRTPEAQEMRTIYGN